MLRDVAGDRPSVAPPRAVRRRLGWRSNYVYELLENGSLIYVGCTGEPFDRLQNHRYNRLGRNITLGSIVKCYGVENGFKFEAYAIRKLRPIENVSIPTLPLNYRVPKSLIGVMSRDQVMTQFARHTAPILSLCELFEMPN